MQPLIASFEIFCSKYKRTEKRDVQKHENQMLNFGLIDKVKGGLISKSFPIIQKVCQITIINFFSLGGKVQDTAKRILERPGIQTSSLFVKI